MSVIRTPPTDRRLTKLPRSRTTSACRALAILLLLSCMLADVSATESAIHNVDFSTGLKHYDAGRYKAAVTAFEKALAQSPASDEFALWLGKACGRVAERAGPLSAMKWAGRTRDALERAVALNPDNREAVSSLADYYEQAPGFLGGDSAKARELRARLAGAAGDAAPVSPP